ncbi:hypothetical protein FsymDg_0839 [Candidatus Protofrankia datiscae]|uniref:Integral membrane protein n=2 Tax=Frankiaceae TaxID=74712 RepID=F8AWF0_9ACTN|nr:hypothetical protein FsymDg_0839 [Candidatus Protofrankia datiscae]
MAGEDLEMSRLFLGSAYTFGAFGGLALGLYGVFLVPAGPRPGGVLLSVGIAVAMVGNTGLAVLARWLTGTRLGAVIPLAGWVPIVLWLAAARPEGDLLLQAKAAGYLFMVLGALAPVVVAMIGLPPRGLSAVPLPGPRNQ